MTATSSTLNIGKELHGENAVYRIESVLGQGSFGITYKAKAYMVMKGKFGEELVESSKPKAIKEFFMKEVSERDVSGSITGMSEGSLSYNYAQKFKKEAENLASMNHPNIVKVIDFISANNTYYYVMDYIDGENLNDYLKHHKLSEDEAVGMIKEVAKALRYMHEEKHMLHLDLKPGNIMRRKSDGHIFLIDFGLSKHYSNDGIPETSTSVGLGTPGYAPIEQANSGKSKHFRATLDVYALGATFYKLLTGETPPDADELVSDEDLVKDNLQKHGIGEKLVDVIGHAMMPGVKHRTQSVEDFLTELGAAQDDEVTVVAVEEAKADKATQKEMVEEPEDDTRKYKKITGALKLRKRFFLWFALGTVSVVVILIFIANNGLETFAPKHIGISGDSVDNKEIFVNGVSFVMVPVMGGNFRMGGTAEQGSDAESDEKPVHNVTLNSYYIGQTEVTQAQWISVMGSNPHPFIWKGDNLPAEGVSWNDCQTFITKLNQLTGQKFRLPTEAEWEYAARGGKQSKGYKYSGSNTLNNVAWYDSNGGIETHPVATKQANELGLYDMSGNVWERCQDWYDENYYKKSPSNNPTGPSSGSCRVYRGGSWYGSAGRCRVSGRNHSTPSIASSILGFRLALSE